MTVTVNGRAIDLPDEARGRNLLEFLREDLDLTGTKNGCGVGMCGTCTVLVDDLPRKACKETLASVAGRRVVTIEGLTPADGTLHPLQQAFVDHGAIQCGFCTPGMVLTAHAFLLRTPSPTRAAIRRAISPNLCRCTGYQQILDAVESAAAHYSAGSSGPGR